jgi:hypothetical protein
MVSGQQAQAGAAAPPEREYPPIAELSVGSMALVIIGGIYIASYAPKTIPLLVPTLLLIGAGAVLAVNLVLLRGLREFAWRPFFLVFRWTLLAYLVIAGMIGYVFVVDGTRGSQLVVLILMLAIFAVDIPLLLSFSVARYQEPGD